MELYFMIGSIVSCAFTIGYAKHQIDKSTFLFAVAIFLLWPLVLILTIMYPEANKDK